MLNTSIKLSFNYAELKWKDLLSNNATWVNKYELIELLDYMSNHLIDINTLLIQTCADGTFVCKIDKNTKEYYSKIGEMNECS